jgi:hypothetical protein
MRNLFDMFFSPLGKEWCLYYLFFLVIAFITMIIAVITAVMSVFTAKKFTLLGFFKNSVVPVLQSIVAYFIMRLGYSICVGALH